MTNEESIERAKHLMEFTCKRMLKGQEIIPMFVLLTQAENQIVAVDPDMMNDGPAKDALAVSIRERIKETGVEACLFLSDMWRSVFEDGPEGYRKAMFMAEHGINATRGKELGLCQLVESIMIRVEGRPEPGMPGFRYAMSRDYKRNKHGRVVELSEIEEYRDESRAAGRFANLFEPLDHETLHSTRTGTP